MNPNPSLEHLDPELLTKTTTTLWQIMWRTKPSFTPDTWQQWTDLEGELYSPQDFAQERLKYWRSLSLSRVLEFRVEKVERELK